MSLNNKSALPFLDTNKDGKLSSLDDPYSPYYPGDDVGIILYFLKKVDWIGFSPLFRGEIYPNSGLNSSIISGINSSNISHGQNNNTANILPPKENIDSDNPFGISFEQQLNGGKVKLYDTYVYDKKKPLILWDIGAAFYAESKPGESEFLIKSSWLSQIINPFVLKKYSLIKAVILSDLYFIDPLCNYKMADYSFTNNPSLLETMKNQVYKLKSNSTLVFAPDNSSLSLLHANFSSNTF